MAQKIRPDLFRLGILNDWKSRWFSVGKNVKALLKEDHLIRGIIMKKIGEAGLSSIEIERKGDKIKIFIKVLRVGLVVGKGGKNLENLKKEIESKVKRLREEENIKDKVTIDINIEEIERQDISAEVVAFQIAKSLEKRLPFRQVIKKNLETILFKPKVKGAKIRVSGRLNGAAIARAETIAKGNLPLSTLRAEIDYGQSTAYTIYGTIGVKVWIYKGEVF